MNRDRTNLLEETIEALTAEHVSGVKWVGVYGASCTWEEFKEIAKDFVYDAGYGGNEVNMSLVVVGEDWWLERHEYDGSEWWEFKTLPQRTSNTRKLEVKDLSA